jgi:hypothetical protein
MIRAFRLITPVWPVAGKTPSAGAAAAVAKATKRRRLGMTYPFYI